jgi:hypothetical protein
VDTGHWIQFLVHSTTIFPFVNKNILSFLKQFLVLFISHKKRITLSPLFGPEERILCRIIGITSSNEDFERK